MAADRAHRAEGTHLADHLDLVFKPAFPTTTLNDGGLCAGDLAGLIYFYPVTALDRQGNHPDRDKIRPGGEKTVLCYGCEAETRSCPR